jgi:hypothetical protein
MAPLFVNYGDNLNLPRETETYTASWSADRDSNSGPQEYEARYASHFTPTFV